MVGPRFSSLSSYSCDYLICCKPNGLFISGESVVSKRLTIGFVGTLYDWSSEAAWSSLELPTLISLSSAFSIIFESLDFILLLLRLLELCLLEFEFRWRLWRLEFITMLSRGGETLPSWATIFSPEWVLSSTVKFYLLIALEPWAEAEGLSDPFCKLAEPSKYEVPMFLLLENCLLALKLC